MSKLRLSNEVIEEIKAASDARMYGVSNKVECPDCKAQLEVYPNTPDNYYKFYLKFIKHSV